MESFAELVKQLAASNPHIAGVLMAIGTARLFMKPIREIIRLTPTKVDDEILEKLEKTRWWKMASWGLDWLVSVPLPRKKK